METVLSVIAPVFMLVVFGNAAVRAGVVSDDNIDHLMRVNQVILTPCLLFTAIVNLDLAASFDPKLLGSFYGGALISYAIGFCVARFVLRRDPDHAVAIGFCCLFSNSVLLGLPIMERAYGAAALAPNYAIVAIHAPVAYIVGIISMEIVRAGSGTAAEVGAKIGRAVFGNALIIGLGLGFVINILAIPTPVFVTEAVALLARAAIPVAVFSLGGVLVRYRPQGDMRAILIVCAISLMIHPALVWGFGQGLGLDTPGFRSAIVTAAMAPGINSYIFANMYNAAKRVAASAVLIGTILNFLTVWFWLSLLP